MGTLVLVLLFLGGTVSAQERHNGNIAERQKAPTVLGGTGLFNTFSTRTLCKGEFNFALFWNNFDRDPGDVDINQVPFNFTIGLTNRWELWVDWITWQQTTSRSPFLLSGYQLSPVRVFGDPFTILGPPVGGTNGSTAFFPGPAPALGGVAPLGGILPTLGFFGTPINFPNGSSLVSPAGAGGPLAVGLGPAIFTDRPSFLNELPFFGEVDFFGFDQLGRAVFGPRQSSNGSGDFYAGTKVNLRDPNKHWFSMALGGYVKIPISRSDHARTRGRTSGEFEAGPVLMLGQENSSHRLRVYENIGYIHTGDIEKGGLKVLNLRDKLLLNAGLSYGINDHVEFVGELAGTVYVGSGTANLNPVNPVDLNLGLRFFFKDGAISFGGAYRRFLNHDGDRGFSVLRLAGFVPAPFRPFVPNFDFPTQVFPEQGSPNGFVAYFSFGRRKECPVPPAPTCVAEATPGTVNRGERLNLTVRPSTPGYTEGTISYEYRWEVKDAQGRPVTVSGSGATVEVPTGQLACGSYTVTTTVTATVPAVDCPSDCITTGQTTCTASFTITEPPCPTVTCSVTATPANVNTGERVTLRANASGGGNLSYSWQASGGSLSSTSGSEVTLDTTGTTGTINVTLNVSTDRTRCNDPCPGASCSTSVNVSRVEERIINPLTPCGPIFFPVNAARINNEHKACLDEIALRLQGDPRSSVIIDGHRDSSERVGISLTRANNARDYLVNEKGVDSSRITVRNFGDTCPHDSGDPALNRRVEFWLIPEGARVEAIDQLKKCAAGASPQVITTEEPAPSVDRRTPPARRRPRRR
jgi:flagellar motor protein MotB